jgi:hypothetical protein
MNSRKVRLEGFDWIHLAQDNEQRVHVNSALNLQVPRNTGNLLTISFSRSMELFYHLACSPKGVGFYF